jgi:hypothetical protein
MLAMDVSDVYYDKILINGSHSTDLKTIDGKKLKAGDKVRLRVSNGGRLHISGYGMLEEKLQ